MVLSGRILLRQPVKGFRSGSDAVLLAAAAHPHRNGHVVDLGCGTGSAMLCLSARRPDIRFTGVEIDGPTAELATFNVRRSGRAAKGRVITSDVADIPMADGSAEMVIANPPYFVEGRHRRSPDADRDRARAETTTPLGEWIRAATRLLSAEGSGVFILRSERVNEAASALPGGWHQAVLPVYGNPDRPPKRSLIQFSRQTLPASAQPVFLHHPGGAETALAMAVFRHAAPIFWR